VIHPRQSQQILQPKGTVVMVGVGKQFDGLSEICGGGGVVFPALIYFAASSQQQVQTEFAHLSVMICHDIVDNTTAVLKLPCPHVRYTEVFSRRNILWIGLDRLQQEHLRRFIAMSVDILAAQSSIVTVGNKMHKPAY